MRRQLLTLSCLAGLALAAAPLAAQEDASTVRPGMSEQDVIQRWGEPVAVRRSGIWTFLFFDNGMERQVGWQDVVFLQNGQVVNAIVRGSGRTYAGQSTSPPGTVPEATLPARPGEGGPDDAGAPPRAAT